MSKRQTFLTALEHADVIQITDSPYLFKFPNKPDTADEIELEWVDEEGLEYAETLVLADIETADTDDGEGWSLATTRGCDVRVAVQLYKLQPLLAIEA